MTEEWGFGDEVDQNDPLVALRIPVVKTFNPSWRFVAAYDDWGYGRSSWRDGPVFVPEPPRVGEQRRPLSLEQVMDRIYSIGEDEPPMPSWLNWKATHPEVFPKKENS